MRAPVTASFRSRALAGTLVLLLAPAMASGAGEPSRKESAGWLGEELPLPLAVRTPHDLAVKAVAERQYLIFNLLARGKLAWDVGDWASAASRWEALLKVPSLDPEVDRVIRPLAAEARARAGGAAPTPPPAAPPPAPPTAQAAAPVRTTSAVTVSGVVAGAGSQGPGGTVVWLKRADGRTPRPAPARGKAINQINKTFVPRVLPVTVGSSVEFKNQDDIFHNVFSLSRPNEFDAGLYKGGQSYSKTFKRPGPVQILCNIHASMIAYVVVVDTPWYGQADGSGAFSIKGVPPGDYDLEAWHEGSAKTTRMKVTVGAEGVRALTVKMAGDRRQLSSVPDKYGKPRQAQLGY